MTMRQGIAFRWFRSHGRRSMWYVLWRMFEMGILAAEITAHARAWRFLPGNFWRGFWSRRGCSIKIRGTK